jgi:hypothetical protein
LAESGPLEVHAEKHATTTEGTDTEKGPAIDAHGAKVQRRNDGVKRYVVLWALMRLSLSPGTIAEGRSELLSGRVFFPNHSQSLFRILLTLVARLVFCRSSRSTCSRQFTVQ